MPSPFSKFRAFSGNPFGAGSSFGSGRRSIPFNPVFAWIASANGPTVYIGQGSSRITLVGSPTLGPTGYTFATGKYATYASAGLFSTTEGTFFADITPTGAITSGASLLDFRSNTNVGPQVTLTSTNIRFFWQGAGKAIGAYAFSTARVFLAGTWKLNGSSLYDISTYGWTSGTPTALATSTDGAALGALNATAYFGANTGGAAPVDAVFSRVYMFDRQLTAAQLGTLV